MMVLLTGGAGYIGSHTARLLLQNGFKVVIYDNLSTGFQEAVKDLPIVYGDIGDMKKINHTISLFDVDAVIHFAASSLVGESVQNPIKYFENNVAKGITFFSQLVRNNIKYVILSSTAAVYGEPGYVPVDEAHVISPTNPYGESKVALERVLQWYHKAYGLRYISLRYFNAAGADSKGDIGEDHRPETHLIPVVLQAALGQRDKVTVFGGDYPTPDGTPVRDYVHVNDLAEAHILGLKSLINGKPKGIYNLGSERGFTVLEVINSARQVTGKDIKFELDRRRQGDPAVLVASSEKIKRELGWRPKYSQLEQIIKSAWQWHRGNPHGFGSPDKHAGAANIQEVEIGPGED